jgi:ATP-dependent DNA helicase DinG
VAGPNAVEVLSPGGLIARKLAGYEHREQQLRMAEVVEGAIARRRHAAVEAGTGTGKSLAYLIPAVLSGKRTICSTANKALQEQIAQKDAPFLQEVLPKRFRAVVVKGRSNYVCLHQLEELRQRPRMLWGEAAAGSGAAARACRGWSCGRR